MSAHRGSHGSYTAIVRKYRDAALRRAEIIKEFKFDEIMRLEKATSFEDGLKSAEKLANDFMAREWRGVENALRLAYQIDGIPEAKISNRPALAMHEGDLFLKSSSFSNVLDYNLDFYSRMPIEKIAGELVLEEGKIATTKGGTEAYRAGIEGRTLPYDRERILLMEPSDFPDAADRKKFLETRADIIATDQLTRANIANPERVAQIRQTAEFTSFRDTIYAAISNPNVIRAGSKIPTDLIGVTSAISNLAIGKVGEDLDLSRTESRALLSDIMYKMQDADPIGTKRLRTLDEKK